MNLPLDLLTPDDGHFEYAAVATNRRRPGRNSGEFTLDVVPTRHYGAYSAWQQFSVLAHNLIRNFQLDTLACHLAGC